MRRIKACACLLALLIFAAALGGCTATNEIPPAIILSDRMPPERGEAVNKSSFEAELYFLSQDEKSLKVQKREVFYDTQTSRAEAALNALIAGPDVDRPDLKRSVSALSRLNRVELCGEVCNVYFEVDKFIPSATEWLKTRAAVAATVAAAEGVDTVNVYFYEQELGYLGYTLGSMSPLEEELPIYLRNMERTYKALYKAESGTAITEDTQYVTQMATLYFANAGGALLTARNAEVSYPEGSTKSEIAKLLIERLAGGDAQGSLEPVLPVDFKLLSDPKVIYSGKTESGVEDTESDCIIELVIEQPDAANYDEAIMCGALTLTITGFIPNVNGVRICIGEEAQPAAPVNQKDEEQAGGTAAETENINILQTLGGDVLRRVDFTDRIGHQITLYYPDADGAVLYGIKRIIPQAAAYDPHARLQELLGGVADPGVAYPLFTAEDVKDVYLSGNVAVIDWAEGFTQKLRAFPDGDSFMAPSRRESMFIYGVVNTLTDMPMISSVWMLENGEKLDTVGQIYLGNALVRNPGLIVEE